MFGALGDDTAARCVGTPSPLKLPQNRSVEPKGERIQWDRSPAIFSALPRRPFCVVRKQVQRDYATALGVAAILLGLIIISGITHTYMTRPALIEAVAKQVPNPAIRAAYFGAKGISSDSSVTATRPFAIVIHFWAIIRSSTRMSGSVERSASATHLAANTLNASG